MNSKEIRQPLEFSELRAVISSIVALQCFHRSNTLKEWINFEEYTPMLP
jgi:hypothetical protein